MVLGLAAAGIMAAAGLGSAYMNYKGQNTINQQQMDQSWDMMKETQRYNTEMSNTAVQRAALDMQKAGINPLLAAGQPASSPQVQGTPAKLENPYRDAMASFHNSAKGIYDFMQFNEQQKLNQSTLLNQSADTLVKTQTQALLEEQTKHEAIKNLYTSALSRKTLQETGNLKLSAKELDYFGRYYDKSINARELITSRLLNTTNLVRNVGRKTKDVTKPYFDNNKYSPSRER